MPSETLRGDVYKRDEFGKWRLVLTASGIAVEDRWKVPRASRQDLRDDLDAAMYATYASWTITRQSDGSLTWE